MRSKRLWLSQLIDWLLFAITRAQPVSCKSVGISIPKSRFLIGCVEKYSFGQVYQKYLILSVIWNIYCDLKEKVFF